ncbi:MAG: DUF350 domain-containing protein [Chitinophagales bacterium]
MENIINITNLTNSVLFSFVGITILVVSFLLIEWVTPQNIYKEVVENKNVAVAIVAGAFILAIAFIVGAAIHG